VVTAERRSADRRIRRVSLRYPERRSGFDRRGAGGSRYRRALERLRDGRLLLAVLLALVVGLQTADVALTARLLGEGAVEMNPVMSGLLATGPPAAVVLKAGVTGLLVAGVWRLRRYRRILEFTLAVAVALGAVVSYQLALLAGT
jgi:hypothetical protein